MGGGQRGESCKNGSVGMCVHRKIRAAGRGKGGAIKARPKEGRKEDKIQHETRARAGGLVGRRGTEIEK